MNEDEAKLFVSDVYAAMESLDRYDTDEVFYIDGETVLKWRLFYLKSSLFE